MRPLQSPLLPVLQVLLLTYHHAALAAPRKSSRDEFVVDKAAIAKHEPAFNSFDGDIFAGHIPMHQRDGNDGELYFMMFDAAQKVHDDTIIVWLNGGPGCSSFAGGLFFEMGPIAVPLRPAGFMGSNKLAPLVPNKYAWTKASAVMYLEQPAGVGFSTGIEPRNEDDLSSDFYSFFQNFLDIFTDYRHKRLYIIGESYAGYYAPSMAHKVHQMNKKNKDPARHINLAGVGVGNGWVDAKVQGEAVIDYAYWHGMIDQQSKQALHEQFQVCLDGGVPKAPLFHAFNVPDECGTMGAVLSAAGAGALKGAWRGGPNTYDISTWDMYPVLLGRNGTIDNFFNNPEIREAIHAPTNVMLWEQCIPGAGRRRLSVDDKGETTEDDTITELPHPTDRMLMLEDDRPLSVMPYISELLDDAGIDVLFYNGDRDMSCCVQGSEKLLNGMAWSGQTNWLNPYVNQRGLWVVDGKVAGYGKGYKNLQFVVVYNSGHLVPYNVPKPALDLVTRFLGGESFVDTNLPIYPGVGGGPKAAVETVASAGSNVDESNGGKGGNNVLTGSLCFVGGIVCSLILGKFIPHKKQRMYMYNEVPSIPPSPGLGRNVQIG